MPFCGFAVLQSVLIVLWLSIAGANATSPTVKQPQVDTPKRMLFVGNSYDYYGSVSKEDSAFVQKVADETVKQLFGS